MVDKQDNRPRILGRANTVERTPIGACRIDNDDLGRESGDGIVDVPAFRDAYHQRFAEVAKVALDGCGPFRIGVGEQHLAVDRQVRTAVLRGASSKSDASCARQPK